MNEQRRLEHTALPADVLDQIDRTCDRFEANWAAGQRQRLEDHLGAVAEPYRPTLLRQLLAAEIDARRRHGEWPEAEEYLVRFPDHTAMITAVFGNTGHLPPPPTRTDAAAEEQTRVPHVRCPYCRDPIKVVEMPPSKEVVCPSCSESFHLTSGNLSWSTATFEREVRHFGRFELHEVIGTGAFGTVWKARDPRLDRTIALKIPRIGNLATSGELDRFVREARAAAQLRHERIVVVHEVGEHEGQPYIVSDLIEGVDLAQWLSAKSATFREAATWVADVAAALQYAHDRGVIHRDIKPSNLMLDGDGSLHIMDFGLAKRDAGEVTMTHDGQILGTPAYMAPEQIEEAHRVDGRADVYAVGVVLYRLITGELPFRGTTRMLLHQVRHDEPRPPRKLNDRIPRDLETICLKAMAKEPGRRYATARDLMEDLRRFLCDEAIRARPEGRVERLWRWCRRNSNTALLAASSVAALVIGTLVSTFFAMKANEEAAEARRQRDQAIGTLDEMRAMAAEWAYEVGRAALQSRKWTVNRLCQVSKYLLESQYELSTTEEGRIAAFDGHQERMKDMEAYVWAEPEAKRASTLDVTEARYYRLEAEHLRGRAMAGLPGARVHELAEARLLAAKQAYENQSMYYEQGRITLDRLLRMSKFLLESQRDAALKEEDRIAAFVGHLDRMKQFEVREKAKLEEGRASISDVAEARYYRLEAEHLRARAMAGLTGARVGELAEARLLAAKEAYENQSMYYEQGRITLDRLLRMSKFLLDSQRDAALKEEDRIAAFACHLDRLKQLEAREKAELKVGRGVTEDLGEARYHRREAEYLLAREIAGRSRAVNDLAGHKAWSASLP